MPPLKARVRLEAFLKVDMGVFLKAPALLEPHYQIV